MNKERRYDVDWIRVLVFDLLIIYHAGMFFCPWGWHLKNNTIVEWLTLPMSFTNSWRLPILFVISGMGTRFALSSKSGGYYIRERISRLFIPLLTGVLLIVPPQVYLERIANSAFNGNYFEFYPHFFKGIYPSGNFSWHHLWFLPYLLVMSIITTPLFLYLRKQNCFIHGLRRIIERFPLGLFIFTLPLLVVEFSLADKFPVTNALIGDWYALAFYFVLFISGYLLICMSSNFWNASSNIKFITLLVGVLSFYLLTFIELNNELYKLIKVINIWAWMITIFGFSGKYLNKESKIIKYRNKAVYPFYILHQTIILIIGFYLMNMTMHYMLKIVIMIVGTFSISWLIYEFIILKVPIIQPLFGVKKK
jgi:hypothetical protein